MAKHFGSAHAQQLYGALHGASKKVKHGGRVNFAAIFLCLFVPWLLFCSMYAVMSFSIHYSIKWLCYFCVGVGLVVALTTVKLAMDSVKKQQVDPDTDPTWLVFLAATCVLAWILGVSFGDLNFFYNMEPFYVVAGLNSYPSVDPSRMPGQQVMDAGAMTFVFGSKLDTDKAMAFHNVDTYCVTPIVNSNVKGPPKSYDFWAAGMNCCSGVAGSFGCGEFNNKAAMSGLRVMRDDHRSFYRLAVKQAESAFGIKANHPLFFHWMQDPGLEIAAYQDEGFKYFLLGAFAFFSLMLFLVIAALVLFS